MKLVSDFVTVDSRGAFYNDVRLRDFYDEERNSELAANFIFTTTPRDRHDASYPYGTLDLLLGFVEGLTRESRENRYRVIATYGQGKSHYAVALANYFGKSVGSSEWQSVVEQATKAANDGTAKNTSILKGFREARNRPFLILMLAGDGVEDLPTLLSEAVDTAIDHQGSPDTPRLELWFARALDGVRRYESSDRGKADDYLAQFDLDLEMLIDALENRRSTVGRESLQTHELSRGLVKQISGFIPDFGGAVDAGDVMRWVIETLCGETGEFGGVVVIFDEFLSFVQGYAQKSMGAPLQNMAEAINDNPGKALLITFSQVDPLTFVSDHSGLQGDLLKKEVNRIETRRTMHSVLELVVSSYLQQNRSRWDQAFDEREAMSLTALVDDASFRVLDVFGQRYHSELNWNKAHFAERVGVGCFPLHPATTALFSSINWAQDQTARSTLQFVLDAAKAKLTQNAQVDGHPNWVMPFELVNYFENMIGREVWESYSAARTRVGGTNEDISVRVLQTVMLLQQTSLKFSSSRKFDDAIAVLLAAPTQQVEAELSVLLGRQIIQRDPTGQCTLAHTDSNASELIRVIDDAVRSNGAYDDTDLASNSKHLNAMLSVEPGIQWKAGKSSDWGVRGELVLVRKLMQAGEVKALLSSNPNIRSAPSRPRFIWAVPHTEEESKWAKNELPKIVNESPGTSNQAIVFLVPEGPGAPFHTSLNRLRAIESIPKSKVLEYGEDLIRIQETSAIEHLKSGWRELSKDRKVIVPDRLGLRITSLGARDLSDVLARIYKTMFPHHPDWLTTVDSKSPKVTGALNIILERIAMDQVGSLNEINTVPGKTVVEYMRQWGILERSAIKLTSPRSNQTVAHAWNRLDSFVVTEGQSRNAGHLFDTLLKDPYGFDTNLASLVLISWLNASSDISVSVNKMRSNLKGTIGALSRRHGSDLYRQLDAMVLDRRSKTDVDQVLEEAFKAFRGKQLTIADAAQTLIQLDEVLRDDTTPPAQVAEARRLHDEINNDLSIARQLEADGKESLNAARRDLTDIRGLVRMASSAGRLSAPERIQVDATMNPETLRSTILQSAERAALKIILDSVKSADSVATCDAAEATIKRTLEAFSGERTQIYSTADQYTEQLRKRRQEIVDREQDRAIVGVVKAHRTALNSRASEETLQEIMKGYGNATEYSANMQQQIAGVQRHARTELAGLENKIAELRNILGQATTREKVAEFLADLEPLEQRISSTNWREEIEDVRLQAQTWQEIIIEVEKEIATQRSSPKEYEQAVRRLDKLLRTDDLLPANHQKIVLTSRNRIASEVEERVASACNDVEDIGLRMKSGRLPAVQAKVLLEQKSPFLSQEADERREQLQNEAERLINSDYVSSIVAMFDKLSSQEERSRVLYELQARV